MRVLGAVLVAAVALAACDEGPGVDGDVVVVRQDSAPEPVVDAEAGPYDRGASDMEADDGSPPIDMASDGPHADMAPPVGLCATPDGVISADIPLEDRARTLALRTQGTESRLAPVCEGDASSTAGRELKVRVVPEVDGEHVVMASGRFTATYRATVCTEDDPPEIDGCQLADPDEGDPLVEGTTRGARIAARAGQAFDIVADAPAGYAAGPLRVTVYPPVAEGGSCAPLPSSEARPSCVAESACVDDRCVYIGPPRIDAVRAWSDGQSLRAAVAYSGVGVVDALWVRTAERDFTQLRLTVNEQTWADGRLGGYLEDPDLAASGEIEVEVLDADERKGRAAVEVERLEPLRPSAACDTQGLSDACSAGDACVEGRCRRSAIEAWLTDDGLNLDVQAPRIPPAVDDVNVVIRPAEAAPDTRWVSLPERPAEIGHRWTALGLDMPEGGLALRIQSSGQPPGLPLAVEALPQPVRGPGEPCDGELITDRCADELACVPVDGVARCVGIDPPEIVQLQGWAAPEALGLKVVYRDPQNDAQLIRFSVFDPDGALRYSTPEPLPLGDVPGTFYESVPAPWGPEPGDRLLVEVIDAAGQISPPLDTRLDRPPPAELDDPCDPLGALAACADDDEIICAAVEIGGAARCQLFEADCPDDWRPFPLEAPARHDDNSAGGPNRTAGLCGGEQSPEAIYEVHAASDARWRITVVPPGASVYVRTHCRFAVPDVAELQCGEEPFEIDVEAGETYYVFVDGPGDGRRFALLIDEVRVPMGPVGPDPVE